MNSANNNWFLTSKEYESFLTLFNKLGPENNKISGSKAKGHLLESKLSTDVLIKIWDLADQDKDGNLSLNEFMVAKKLIAEFSRGTPIPSSLPSDILNSVTQLSAPKTPAPQFVKSYDNLSDLFTDNMMSSTAPAQQPYIQSAFYNNESQPPTQRPYNSNMSFSSSQLAQTSTSSSQYTNNANVPSNNDRLSQLFYSITAGKFDAKISGEEARKLLFQSGLSSEMLGSIWQQSDVDGDGQLSLSEFIKAVTLIEARLGGRQFNPTLSQFNQSSFGGVGNFNQPPQFPSAVFPATNQTSGFKSADNFSNFGVTTQASYQTTMGGTAFPDFNTNLPSKSTEMFPDLSQTQQAYTNNNNNQQSSFFDFNKNAPSVQTNYPTGFKANQQPIQQDTNLSNLFSELNKNTTTMATNISPAFPSTQLLPQKETALPSVFPDLNKNTTTMATNISPAFPSTQLLPQKETALPSVFPDLNKNAVPNTINPLPGTNQVQQQYAFYDFNKNTPTIPMETSAAFSSTQLPSQQNKGLPSVFPELNKSVAPNTVNPLPGTNQVQQQSVFYDFNKNTPAMPTDTSAAFSSTQLPSQQNKGLPSVFPELNKNVAPNTINPLSGTNQFQQQSVFYDSNKNTSGFTSTQQDKNLPSVFPDLNKNVPTNATKPLSGESQVQQQSVFYNFNSSSSAMPTNKSTGFASTQQPPQQDKSLNSLFSDFNNNLSIQQANAFPSFTQTKPTGDQDKVQSSGLLDFNAGSASSVFSDLSKNAPSKPIDYMSGFVQQQASKPSTALPSVFDDPSTNIASTVHGDFMGGGMSFQPNIGGKSFDFFKQPDSDQNSAVTKQMEGVYQKLLSELNADMSSLAALQNNETKLKLAMTSMQTELDTLVDGIEAVKKTLTDKAQTLATYKNEIKQCNFAIQDKKAFLPKQNDKNESTKQSANFFQGDSIFHIPHINAKELNQGSTMNHSEELRAKQSSTYSDDNNVRVNNTVDHGVSSGIRKKPLTQPKPTNKTSGKKSIPIDFNTQPDTDQKLDTDSKSGDKASKSKPSSKSKQSIISRLFKKGKGRDADKNAAPPSDTKESSRDVGVKNVASHSTALKPPIPPKPSKHLLSKLDIKPETKNSAGLSTEKTSLFHLQNVTGVPSRDAFQSHQNAPLPTTTTTTNSNTNTVNSPPKFSTNLSYGLNNKPSPSFNIGDSAKKGPPLPIPPKPNMALVGSKQTNIQPPQTDFKPDLNSLFGNMNSQTGSTPFIPMSFNSPPKAQPSTNIFNANPASKLPTSTSDHYLGQQNMFGSFDGFSNSSNAPPGNANGTKLHDLFSSSTKPENTLSTNQLDSLFGKADNNFSASFTPVKDPFKDETYGTSFYSSSVEHKQPQTNINMASNFHTSQPSLSTKETGASSTPTKHASINSASMSEKSESNDDMETFEPPISVVALEDFHASETDFSFKRGDRLQVLFQNKTYYYSEVGGAGDWFPIQLVSRPDKAEGFNPTYPALNFCVAKFSNQVSSDDEEEVSFAEKDVLIEIDDLGDWCKGYVNGRVGIFPKNYTEKLDEFQLKYLKTVQHDYKAKSEWELDLSQHDSVAILYENSDGWCYGVKKGSDKIGAFPISILN